nr:hypothetical protein GCM10020092_046530 [Actinoplanes digitatis]
MFAAWNQAKQARCTTCGSWSPPSSASSPLGQQTGLVERGQRRLDLGDHVRLPVGEARLFGVAALVVRGELALGDLRGDLEERVERLPGVLGEAWPRGQRLDVEPFVEQELEITLREDVGHRGNRRFAFGHVASH